MARLHKKIFESGILGRLIEKPGQRYSLVSTENSVLQQKDADGTDQTVDI